MTYIVTLIVIIKILFAPSSTSVEPFCIDGIATSTTAQSAEHILTLPDGDVYEGVGALPFKVIIGKYSGIMSSIVLSQTPTDQGMDVTLIHFFDDGEGNTFWTSDEAVMTPTNDPSGAVMSVDDMMTVVGGTGDFICANGMLKNTGTINFITFQLEVALSGQVCGGCS